MQINNRMEDLTKVFDRTWKANHNDDVKKAREKEKNFIDRLFNVRSSKENNNNNNNIKPLTPNEQVGNLQRNINGMNSFNNQTKLNNIRGKFN